MKETPLEQQRVGSPIEEVSPEKDKQIAELEKRVEALEFLNQEYCMKIERLKTYAEVTEDRFY